MRRPIYGNAFGVNARHRTAHYGAATQRTGFGMKEPLVSAVLQAACLHVVLLLLLMMMMTS